MEVASESARLAFKGSGSGGDTESEEACLPEAARIPAGPAMSFVAREVDAVATTDEGLRRYAARGVLATPAVADAGTGARAGAGAAVRPVGEEVRLASVGRIAIAVGMATGARWLADAALAGTEAMRALGVEREAVVTARPAMFAVGLERRAAGADIDRAPGFVFRARRGDAHPEKTGEPASAERAARAAVFDVGGRVDASRPAIRAAPRATDLDRARGAITPAPEAVGVADLVVRADRETSTLA